MLTLGVWQFLHLPAFESHHSLCSLYVHTIKWNHAQRLEHVISKTRNDYLTATQGPDSKLNDGLSTTTTPPDLPTTEKQHLHLPEPLGRYLWTINQAIIKSAVYHVNNSRCNGLLLVIHIRGPWEEDQKIWYVDKRHLHQNTQSSTGSLRM